MAQTHSDPSSDGCFDSKISESPSSNENDFFMALEPVDKDLASNSNTATTTEPSQSNHHHLTSAITTSTQSLNLQPSSSTSSASNSSNTPNPITSSSSTGVTCSIGNTASNTTNNVGVSPTVPKSPLDLPSSSPASSGQDSNSNITSPAVAPSSNTTNAPDTTMVKDLDSPNSGSNSNASSTSSNNASSTSTNNASTSSPSLATVQKMRQEEEYPYSIRLTPYIDHSSPNVSNHIPTVERIAKNETIFRVGRLTDRTDNSKSRPELAPVVFRSKVVSRSHAQLSVKDGQWFVQDVKSSSGTFLNHVRLSPQGAESHRFPLKDGDVLQLGMDFRGGTEDLYKCIKVRVEVNRSWQRRANTFNIDALGKIKALHGLDLGDLQECSICLSPLAVSFKVLKFFFFFFHLLNIPCIVY